MRRAIVSLSTLSLGLLVLTACGSPAKKLCKKTADCDPDYDVDTCLEDYEELEEAAEELGCQEVVDDFVKCAAKDGECVDGYIEPVGCTGEAVAYIDCFFGDFTYSTFTNTTWDTGY